MREGSHLRSRMLPHGSWERAIVGLLWLTCHPEAPAATATPPPEQTSTQEIVIPPYAPPSTPPPLGKPLPESAPIYALPGNNEGVQGIEPERLSRQWLRLLNLHSYEGDRWFYQDVRRESLWDLEPRVGYSWRYDSNILQTEADHIADWYETVEAGLHFRLGKLDGKPADLDSIFALETDYAASQDWFLSNQNFNAFNQKGKINLRLGREDLIFRPYFEAYHQTGASPLESALSARFTSTNLLGGMIIDQAITPALINHLDYSWGQLDQQSDANVGYQTWKIYHEFIWQPISSYAKLQDQRYLTENSLFTWGSAENASANNRTAQVHYLLGGIGTRAFINSALSYTCKLGWENIERGWDTQVGRDLSTCYLESSLRYDFNRHTYMEFFWGRGYQLSQTNDDDNYIDTYMALGPVFKFDPGWQLHPAFNLGTTSSEQDEKTFYLVPSTELAYVFPNREKTKVAVRVEYDESRSLRGSGGDIVGWRTNCSISLDF